jgi:hypothetical protein
MTFCTFSKEIQESSPYIDASDRCNKCVCEHVLHDAHDKRFTIIKIGEIYALSAKTEQSSLANRTIQFCQAKPPKLEHPIYKTGTSDFSRHSIVTRQHSSLNFRHLKKYTIRHE